MGEAEKFRAMLVQGRKAKGLTQMDVTLAVGLRQPVTVSRYETGTSFPEPPMVERLIALYDLDAEEVWPLWGLAYAERAREALGSSGQN
jgi:transcriptional regulator with XRE-family HTH domain